MRFSIPMATAFAACAPAVAVQAAVPAALAQVEAAMAQSAAGWNAGSLERFVAIYADDATFVGKDGLVQGKAAITARYRPSFGSGGNMRGRLSFDMLGHRVIGPAQLLLFARWRLQSADATKPAETGMTTLLFERRRDGWKIVADHSS